MAASEYPRLEPYRHLLDVMDAETAPALSHRAAAGFLGRLQRGNLGRHPGFREDVARHVELTEPRGAGLAAEAAWTGGR